jgi:hypothetical protein
MERVASITRFFWMVSLLFIFSAICGRGDGHIHYKIYVMVNQLVLLESAKDD